MPKKAAAFASGIFGHFIWSAAMMTHNPRGQIFKDQHYLSDNIIQLKIIWYQGFRQQESNLSNWAGPPLTFARCEALGSLIARQESAWILHFVQDAGQERKAERRCLISVRLQATLD
jgi:hypothetical protein